MASELRLPNLSGNEREQLVQLRSYLYQLIPALQYEFDQLDSKIAALTTKVENIK